MTFLLCDLSSEATFGKINLKNLRKLRNIDLSTDKAFREASGLGKTVDKVHDAIEHGKIPLATKRYLPGAAEIEYKTKTKFLPLVNNSNQVKPVTDDTRKKANTFIEAMTNGVDGSSRPKYTDQKPYIIGRAVRKKKLTKAEQLLTGNLNSPFADLRGIVKGTEEPTQKIVDRLILNNSNKKPSRFTPKTKGSKPQPQTIEQKKQGLKQKYGI